MVKLADIKGIGPKTAEKFNALRIFEVKDLLDSFPVSLLDLDAAMPPEVVENGDFVLFKLEITSVAKPFRKGRIEVFRAAGEVNNNIDSSKPYKVKLTFYNSNYVVKTVKTGATLRVYGKVVKTGRSFEFINPVCEAFDPSDAVLRGIKPIYYTRGLVGQAVFSNAVADATSKFYPETLIPEAVSAEFGLQNLKNAYVSAHFPMSLDEAKRARERVYIEETVKRILSYRYIRGLARRTKFYKPCDISPILDAFPYELSPSQSEAVKGIVAALLSEKPLNGMLCGDVGSGKTAVCVCVSFFAAMSKRQTAIIAPTEILAEQHLAGFTKILSPFGIKCACLTGSTPAKERREILKGLENDEIAVIIGTHALLTDKIIFNDLAVAIIDEQHRFGVAQRTKLVSKGENVDVLTLSATPIPRSLRLTMFGDVDIFEINRRHSADNIETFVVGTEKRKSMLAYIAKETQADGVQAFIVAPMIEDSEGISAKGEAATELFKEFVKAHPDCKCALLHGKMKAAEKSEVLNKFRSGETRVLISTTVIEVGIDVPNASILTIFSAERFGLASLHQLRGRIGRNGAKSYCFLYTEKDGELYRLKTMCEETDGIKIAERDYELRGAGEWLGERQSGKAIFSPTISQMSLARKIADSINITDSNIPIFKDYCDKNNLDRVTLN
ncbi:MAG: ATP-dependent DNA helicase RecG [Christensenellaceae bacterium]|jgi:ATP-dependent DNA helicase RecG|nr:ATP-dependent DNA helicase RecG [Christensenellaceae bacterium]